MVGRRLGWSLVPLVIAACGGSQEEARGPIFCTSFESRYLATCQQVCEAPLAPGDTAGQEGCRAQCREDLGDESEYTEHCQG